LISVFDLSDSEDDYDPSQDPDADFFDEHGLVVLSDSEHGISVRVDADAVSASGSGCGLSAPVDVDTVVVSGDEDVAVSAHPIMNIPYGLSPGSKFERALRSVVEPLLDKVQNMSISCYKEERPITWTFFLGLRRYDVGTLINNVMSVTLPHVKVLFEKDKWTVYDLLALPLLRYDDMRMVTYCHLLNGLFRDQEFECDGYVGFSGRGGNRRLQHEACIRSGAHNLHYDRARLLGTLGRFVLLAVFGPGVDAANAQLVEGLFMILFDTCRWRGKEYSGSTLATFKLVETIRDPALYSPGWNGLNSCWSLKQGIPGTKLGRASECRNIPCGNIAAPRRALKLMESHPVTMTRRFMLQEDDPLAGFICSYCHGYRQRDCYHNLPGAEYVAGFQAQQKRLKDKKAGVQVKCGNCDSPQDPNAPDYTWSEEFQMILCRVCRASKYGAGELRSLDAKNRLDDKQLLLQNVGMCQNGMCPVTEEINRLKYGRPLGYSKAGLRCGGCYAYLIRYHHDREAPEDLAPIPDELAKLREKPPRVCRNCQAVEGFPGVSKTWNKSGGKDICRPCYRASNDRDPQLQRLQEAQAEADIVRKSGRAILCPCNRREGESGTKKFKVHKLLLVPLCRNCSEKDSRAAKTV
jgi:hypothetical protein